jgi:hypothetical protein
VVAGSKKILWPLDKFFPCVWHGGFSLTPPCPQGGFIFFGVSMAILKQKIELDQAGPDSYVVRSLTNRLDPVVGSVINKDAVEKLLSTSRQYKGKITVVVKPRP